MDDSGAWWFWQQRKDRRNPSLIQSWLVLLANCLYMLVRRETTLEVIFQFELWFGFLRVLPIGGETLSPGRSNAWCTVSGPIALALSLWGKLFANLSTIVDSIRRRSLLTALPIGTDMRPFFNELHASFITFPNFVCWQRLIARNVAELSSSYHGDSHSNETCCIDELSKGSVLGLQFSQTTSNRNVP
jgi:hypothetical protein